MIWVITTIVWDIFLVMGAVTASRYDTRPLPLFGAFARSLDDIGKKNPGAPPFEPDPAKQQEYWQAQQYKMQQQQYGQQMQQQPPSQEQDIHRQRYSGQPQAPHQTQQPLQGQPIPQAPPVHQKDMSQGYGGQPQQTQPPTQGQTQHVPYQGQAQKQQTPPPLQPQQAQPGQPVPQGQMPPQGQPQYRQAQPSAGAPQEWYRGAPAQPYQAGQPKQQFQGKQSGYFTVGERRVSVDRNNYTGEEIMDRLLKYAQLPGQPYFKKMWNKNYVVIPGAGTKDMLINHTGMPGQFILSEIDRPGTLGKSVLMAGLTSGMADVFESVTSNLNQLMDQVANEIHRLFGIK